MLRHVINQWYKNKNKLEKHITENLGWYEEITYLDLVKKVIDLILNDEETENSNEEFDTEAITEIDNGDYQGTLLYLIPRSCYQPSEVDYLLTYVGYGSCCGCDTLQNIQVNISYAIDSDSDPDELWRIERRTESISDLMTLSLHLIQKMVKPYKDNYWDGDKYDTLEAMIND